MPPKERSRSGLQELRKLGGQLTLKALCFEKPICVRIGWLCIRNSLRHDQDQVQTANWRILVSVLPWLRLGGQQAYECLVLESRLELPRLLLHHDRLREKLGRKSRRLVRGLDRAGAARKRGDWFLKLADE